MVDPALRLAQKEPVTAGDLFREIGAPGTIVTSGFIIDDEHAAELRGRAALDVWDRMRRGDAQVAASLLSIELPIRAAVWDVSQASDSSDDQERADFVRRNLLGGMSVTWDDTLRQAMLHLAFGFMCFEKVYEERAGAIALAKLAPRLPRSIWQWDIAPDATLRGVKQLVYSLGTGTSYMPEIPGDRLVVLTHRREGANFAGMSLLRGAYKHWKIKDALYRLDAIRHERFGVGVPTMTLPAGYQAKDQENAVVLMRELRSHEQSYLVVPPGFQASVLQAPSSGIAPMMESIKHHNIEITKNVFAQFLDLGSTETGARALGESMQDFFLLGVSAVARYIEDTFNAQVVRPLIDLNWPGVKDYPRLFSSGVDEQDVGALADTLQKLAAAGFLSPTPDLEAFLRERLDLPEKPELKSEPAADPTKPAANPTIQLSDPRKPKRPAYLTEVIALSEISDRIDQAEKRFRSEVATIELGIARRIAKELVGGVTPDQVRAITITPAERAALKAKVVEISRELYDFGAEQVRAELRRQKRRPEVAREMIDARKKLAEEKRPAKKVPISESDPADTEELIGLSAEVTADRMANGLLGKAQTLGTEALKGSLSPAQVASQLEDFVVSDIGSLGKGVVQESFSAGRAKAFRDLGDSVDHYVRTEILDENLCDHCAAWDDKRFDSRDDPDMVELPDARCLGAYRHPGACRGIYVAVLKAETGA